MDNFTTKRVDVSGLHVIPSPSIERAADLKVAVCKEDHASAISQVPIQDSGYQVTEYVTASLEEMELTASNYVKKEYMQQIIERMQRIIDTEAPITYDRLMRKTLRAFHISRSSQRILEASDRALRKTLANTNKQAGIKFYWRKDQNPELYRI